MLNLEEFLKQKSSILPDWLAEHKALQEVKSIEKVFPSIGLANFSEEADIKNTEIIQSSTNLLYRLYVNLHNAYYHFYDQRDSQNLAVQTLIRSALDILDLDRAIIASNIEKLGKLYTTRDVVDIDNKVIVAKGISVFKLYNHFQVLLDKDYHYTMLPIDKIEEFKEFSAANLGGTMKIVFASDEAEGAWDLTTMSMRGIKSCQGWDGQYRNCLIGSLMDPFTAIIYSTTGSKLIYGTKMIRRSIVRFVVDRRTNQPALFIDKMYPGHDVATVNAFTKILLEKTRNKFPVINYTDLASLNQYYIPKSKLRSDLLNHVPLTDREYVNASGSHNLHGILSYRDSFIEFKAIDNTLLILEKAKERLKLDLRDTIYAHLNANTFLTPTTISILEKIIPEMVFNSIALDNDLVPSSILKKACLDFFRSPSRFSNNLIDSFQREFEKRKHIQIISSVSKIIIRNGDPNDENASNFEHFIRNELTPLISKFLMIRWSKLFKNFKSKKTKK